MKFVILFAGILFFCSCGREPKKYVIRTVEKKYIPQTDAEDVEEDSTDWSNEFLFEERARVNGRNYTIYSGSEYVFVLNSRKDTVFKLNESGNARFLDFNRDGYKDLYIGYMTNVPDINDLALFDTLSGKFRLVEDLSDFPASQKIKGTDYYYSYHRSGCADLNWGSDLFYIKDYKTVRIGTIEGLGCENDPKQGIFVRKVTGRKEKLIRSFYLSTIDKYKNYKWGFIHDYWAKNYTLFVPDSI